MKKHSETGFSVIEAWVILMILGAVGFAGWLVWHRHTVATAKKTHTVAVKPQPTSFDECVRAGGFTELNDNVGSTGKNDALSYATCQMDYRHSQLFLAGSDDCGSDINTCYPIVEAARRICVTSTNPDPGTDAVFKYDPVIHGEFARMDLVNCSHDYSDTTTPTQTLFLKMTAGKWSIYRTSSAIIQCKDVDGSSIPLALNWTCTDTSGAIRLPHS